MKSALVSSACLMAGTAMLGASCGASKKPAALPVATVLDVTMKDYEFEHDRAVTAGRLIVQAMNKGKLQHELVMVAIPTDLTVSIDTQLRSRGQQRALRTLGFLPSRPTASRGVFAVDVQPGRYAFICFVKGEDGEQHSLKGMSSELMVTR